MSISMTDFKPLYCFFHRIFGKHKQKLFRISFEQFSSFGCDLDWDLNTYTYILASKLFFVCGRSKISIHFQQSFMFSLTRFEINNKWTIALRNVFGMLTNAASTAFHLLFLQHKMRDFESSSLRWMLKSTFTPRFMSPTQTHSESLSLTAHFEWSWVLLKKIALLNLIFDTFQTLRPKRKRIFELNQKAIAKVKLAYLVVCVQLDEISLPLRHVSTYRFVFNVGAI